MRLPRELGELRIGRIPAAPVETAAGRVQVYARGIEFVSKRGGLRWLQPVEAEVIRPNGRREQTRIGDVTGRVLLILGGAGLGVVLICETIRRKWGRN